MYVPTWNIQNMGNTITTPDDMSTRIMRAVVAETNIKEKHITTSKYTRLPRNSKAEYCGSSSLSCMS